MFFSQCSSRKRGQERGNIMITSLLLVSLLAALATAHFATVQKSSRQSAYYNDLSGLRRYAESGVRMALYELAFKVGGDDGIIGTENWMLVHDWGVDGRPGTLDEGEGDGLPTAGEPKVVAVPIGPANEGGQLFVYCTDTEWAGVKHIVSTAFDSNTHATVEVYARVSGVTTSSALYLEPGIALDLSGNAFRVSGRDTNPGGSPGAEPTLYGITTAVGDPPGSAAQAIAVQVPTRNQDQIIGLGGSPSIGESGAVNFQEVFEMFKKAKTQEVTAGS